MKCEVIIARESGYEFYTNVKCRPYPPPYYCVQVTRTPRWADDFIYPGILRVHDTFLIHEEHERKYHTDLLRRTKIERKTNKYKKYKPKIRPMGGIIGRRPGCGVKRIFKPSDFYAINIPVKKNIAVDALNRYQEDDMSITLEECEFGKYLEVKKVYNWSLKEMREPVDRTATKLRLRYNPLDLVVATYMKLKIAMLGVVKVTKKTLK